MKPYAYAIYCDDIRQEISGKVTLVGTYTGSLLVRSFPVTLPKLCLALNVVTPVEGSFGDLKIRITHNEVVIAEGGMTAPDLHAAFAATRNCGDDNPSNDGRQLLAGFHFIFSPIRLEEPGRIRVHVEAGGEEFKANALRIEQLDEADAAN
ncbi:hypothetical protein [Denitratimonas sp. CY0512]|uniref:DUF6941 family protein n=1 Tax=Denitratimonas sp. CY0512 TaxID=3131940 RepID=UPI0030A9FAA1